MALNADGPVQVGPNGAISLQDLDLMTALREVPGQGARRHLGAARSVVEVVE